MTDLKSCPFCGGPAITLKDHRRMGVYICCQECFCNTPTGEQKEVTAIWNSRRAAEQQEPVGWPKERVCIPDPHQADARIIGFRIREGDEAWGEMGISEPLFWLERLFASPQPPVPPGSGVSELLDAYDAETAKVPLGHEDVHRGRSTYNWRREVVRELRELHAALLNGGSHDE